MECVALLELIIKGCALVDGPYLRLRVVEYHYDGISTFSALRKSSHHTASPLPQPHTASVNCQTGIDSRVIFTFRGYKNQFHSRFSYSVIIFATFSTLLSYLHIINLSFFLLELIMFKTHINATKLLYLFTLLSTN